MEAMAYVLHVQQNGILTIKILLFSLSAICTASDACTTCEEKYFLSGGACTACDISCKTCDANGATDCTSCYSTNGLIPDDNYAPKFGCIC